MSTHTINTYRIKMRPHPKADALSLMDLPNGNVAVLRTQDWTDGELAAHIEPDYEVNVTVKGFEWLAQPGSDGKPRKEWERVKPIKLRGIRSFGVMIPIREIESLQDVKEGDNIIASLEGIVRRYEPPVDVSVGGETAPSPSGVIAPKYDVESYTKLVEYFVPDEPVIITEKLHGSSMRAVCINGEVHIGSRTEWKRDAENNAFWMAYRNTPGLDKFLRENEGVVVYGEMYGQNPGYGYGTTKNKPMFAAFDLLIQGENGPRWADWNEILRYTYGFGPDSLPWVPAMADVGEYYKFDLEFCKAKAEGPTMMPTDNPKDIREGIVVRPIKERMTPTGERLQVKFVSLEYLSR